MSLGSDTRSPSSRRFEKWVWDCLGSPNTVLQYNLTFCTGVVVWLQDKGGQHRDRHRPASMELVPSCGLTISPLIVTAIK